MTGDGPDKRVSDELAQNRTEMALQRTRWAADRTLWAADRTFIAWLRTAISMIGFGFAIGKAGDALAAGGIYADTYSLQIFGSAFLVLAILGLSGAVWQEVRSASWLADGGYPGLVRSAGGTVGGLLVLMVGFGGVLWVLVCGVRGRL